MLLRPYQTRAILDVTSEFANGHRRVLLQFPTGTGKTLIAVSIVKQVATHRVLYVVPSDEVFKQTSKKLADLKIRHTLLMAGERPDLSKTKVLLAMSHTLIRRTETKLFDIWRPDLIILDEIHKLIDQHLSFLDLWSESYVIGMSASPVRLDGRDIGDLTPYIITSPQIRQFQKDNYLVPCVTYTGPTPSFVGLKIVNHDYEKQGLERRYMTGKAVSGIVNTWVQRARGKRTIAFTSGVTASQRLAEAFRKQGYKAEHIDANTPAAVRAAALDKLRRKEIDVLCNVGLFVEGLDLVETEVIMLCFGTQSLAKYIQSAGRGLRMSPKTGKSRLVVLDFGNNCYVHGLIDANRDWLDRGKSLDGQLSECVACGAVRQNLKTRCPACLFDPGSIREGIAPETKAFSEVARSKRTLSRPCPPWASAVEKLWYDCERERVCEGLPLPSPTTSGYTETQCRRALRLV